MELIRYYLFALRWLWKNRSWKNRSWKSTRQKWKALDRAWAEREKERKNEARKSV